MNALEREIVALKASLAFHQEQSARLALHNADLIALTDGATRSMLVDVIQTLPAIPQKIELLRILYGLPRLPERSKSQLDNS